MADTENTQTPETKPEGEKTPWGEDFDPARAWKLVENLRAEVAGLKEKNRSYESDRQAREDAEKTELQKLQDRVEAAERAAKEKDRELALAKVLRKHPELEEFSDLLTGETEEDLFAKAERLAAIGKPKSAEGEKDGEKDGEQSTENVELPGKPAPNLTPGHGGDETQPFDPVAIAKAARR